MKLSRYSIILLSALFLTSCTSIPVKPPPGIVGTNQMVVPVAILPQRHDVLHIIAPGETLWRIGKMYDVTIKDIMSANKLRDPTKIEMGQELLIPRAAPIIPIIPLYESKKWKYIIVHHSATDEGNAFSFYNMHIRRGFWNGLGYHFVIDNGTFGKEDGQIEISPRWIKQQKGAHCKAAGMNYIGIGICLVGNFSKERVSEKQLDSLAHLVNVLRKYYNIPKSKILGHGQVSGAATECPGLKFHWQRFWSKLNSKR